MIKRVLCIALGMVLGLSIFAMIPLQANAADMQVSNACVELIKRMEGFTPVPKWDYSQWTVGFGTTCPDEHRQRYTEEGIPIEEAEALLAEKLIYFDERVNNFIQKHDLTLTQGQYDAIFSMTYNLGAAWLGKTESTLVQAILNGTTGNEFVAAMSGYCTAGGNFLYGLMMRRLIEAEMYLYGRYNIEPQDYYSYVKYNANGGERSASGQGYDTRYAAKPMATATYEGYTFLGWYTEAEGGTKVTALDESHNGMTLYAHWTEGGDVGTPIDPVRVTVTADVLNVRAGAGTGYTAVTQVKEGAQLDITAVTMVGSSLWGRCDQGWVSLDYTTYKQVVDSQGGANAGKTFATITASAVNVRAGAGASYTKITTLHSGDVVEILEQTDVDGKIWGRYEKGWFRITGYATLETVSGGETENPGGGETVAPNPGEGTAPPPSIEKEVVLPEAPAKATVLGTGPLVIRNGPHKGYPSRGEYAVESRVEILEFIHFMGELWGRTDKGWIPVGDYVMLNDADSLVNTFDITVTAKSLYVRNGPGAGYDYVRTVNKGAKLTVYAIKDVNGTPWGRIYCGWISLKYTNYEPSMVPDQTPKPDCDTLGHSYASAVTMPTCTEKGFTTHTCEMCGHSYTDTEVEAMGHQYSEQTVAPTCTANGYVLHTCAVCAHTYTDREVAALDHSYSSVVTPPTNTEQGYTTHTCTVCSHSYVDSYTDPVKDTVIITVTKTYATVTASAVNVRKGAGASFGKVTTVHRGDVVEILEQAEVDGKIWGRYEDGWFRLTGYATLQTVTTEVEVPAPDQPVEPKPPVTEPEPPVTEPDPPVTEPEPPVTEAVTKIYATITASAVNVRKGAGASFGKVTTVHRGDVVEILEQAEVDGKLWGRYEKGWFRITGYATLETVTTEEEVEQPSQPETPVEPPVTQPTVKEYATITAGAVNVRKGAGADNARVTTLHKGDVVEILEKTEVDGKIWGRYEKGWFRITGYATLKTVEA